LEPAAADARDLIPLSANLPPPPALRFQEVKAAAGISELAASRHTAVERGLGGLPTALRARAGTAGGARVAILAEYDALPEIGHACGHNLIAAGAVRAFLAPARLVPPTRGEVLLLRPPPQAGGRRHT